MRTELGSWRRAWRRVGKVGKAEVEVEEAEARRRALLERRLYVVVYRLNLAPTIFAARQLVSHKHILVNDKVVNIASYLVSKGDKIYLTESAKNMKLCIETVEKAERMVLVEEEEEEEEAAGMRSDKI